MIDKVSFLIDTSPFHLLDHRFTYIGFDLRSTIIGAKAIPGKKNRSRDMVYAYQKVCFFPTKFPNEPDCIWVNPDHVVSTKASGTMTQVDLSNGFSMIMDCDAEYFNHKLEAANQLKKMSIAKGHKPDLQAKWDRLSKRV
jgi:competence transcription factor ComK